MTAISLCATVSSAWTVRTARPSILCSTGLYHLKVPLSCQSKVRACQSPIWTDWLDYDRDIMAAVPFIGYGGHFILGMAAILYWKSGICFLRNLLFMQYSEMYSEMHSKMHREIHRKCIPH